MSGLSPEELEVGRRNLLAQLRESANNPEGSWLDVATVRDLVEVLEGVRVRVTQPQIAEVLELHRIECFGPGEVSCRDCRDKGWMSTWDYVQHVAAAVSDLTGGEKP